MSETEFIKIFSKRLKYYLDYYNISQADLARRLGVGTTSVSNWVNGIKTPRMSKVDMMCEIFHPHASATYLAVLRIYYRIHCQAIKKGPQTKP